LRRHLREQDGENDEHAVHSSHGVKVVLIDRLMAAFCERGNTLSGGDKQPDFVPGHDG
jgi:hypothetical protein